MVMVIVGIIAAIAIPRFFSNSTFQSRGFYEQVISTLRYAQKAAIAQHHFVCVAFAANSVTLTIGATAACGTDLTGPTGQAPYSASSSNASFQGSPPAAFSFDALGRPYDPAGVLLAAKQSITVSGYATSIIVEAQTGYVH